MLIKTFEKLRITDTDTVGGKGASLGEMVNVGIRVPEGFVVLSEAFKLFFAKSSLGEKITRELKNISHNDLNIVADVSRKIQDLILKTKIPETIESEIIKEFKVLKSSVSTNSDNFYVAVRSSATAEDGHDDAWAGQLDTFLNVSESDLIKYVKKCWTSLFTERAISYRFERGINDANIHVAVIVQKMINSEKAGVAFSVHPVKKDANQIVIEAGFGLGESVVSGIITPDVYVLDKKNNKILDIKINKQTKALYNKKNVGTEWRKIKDFGKRQVLSKREILNLTKVIKKIEEHYKKPQDIEWAIENDVIYITQSRPITTLGVLEDKAVSDLHQVKINDEIISFFEKNKNLSSDFNDYKLLFDIEDAPPFFIEAAFNAGYLDNGELFTYTKKDGVKLYYNKKKLNKYATEGEKIFLNSDNIKSFFSSFIKINKRIREFVEENTDNVINNADSAKLKRILKEYRKKEEDFYKLYKYTESIYFVSLEKKIEKYLKKEFGNKYKKSYLFDVIYGDLKIKNKEIISISKMLKLMSKKKLEMRSVVALMVDLNIKILDRIAEKNNMTLEEIELLYMDEIISLIDGSVSVSYIGNKIKDREKGLVFVADGLGDYVEYRNELATPLIKRLEQMKSISIKKKLYGQIVNTGNAKGRVLLVPYVAGENSRFLKDVAKKFKDGDILIARNTTPELMPIIKKASAVVTKEGGIICHAAIIAREFNIPGIVGVEGLFANLKTGDIVEVDAYNGVLNIIDK